MYTLFRDNLKICGFRQSMFRIEQTFYTNAFLMDTLKNTSIFMSHLPLTKRVFLVLMKLRLNFIKTK